jgi:pimeloyl-ACP methyl ester carboxylesterase
MPPRSHVTSKADPPLMDDARFTVVAGLRTRYLRRGDGPPVVVLHGWGGSIEAVAPIVLALQATNAVFALDLPGFGESDPPPRAWGVEDYQRFLTAFLDSLGLGRVAVVGHSNGGRVAIRTSATEPQRVSRLVLVDSAGIRPRRGARYYGKVAMAKVGKYAARYLSRPGERLRTYLVGRAASSDYANAGAMRPTLVRLVKEDLRDLLPRISAPTLLIWGSQDTATPLSDGRLMEQLIPDAGLVVLEGAGHYSYLDQPRRFATIISHFLGRG